MGMGGVCAAGLSVWAARRAGTGGSSRDFPFHKRKIPTLRQGVGCRGEGLMLGGLLSFPRPQVYPPHAHSYPALPLEESVSVLPTFQE